MIWFLLACTCSQPEEEIVEHDQGLTQKEIIFKTVENLGPHFFKAIIDREEYRNDKLSSHHQELVEIYWNDWDNFSFERKVGERTVESIVVIDGKAWMLNPNRMWSKKKDAEPYRVNMRSSWNVWRQLFTPFSGGLVWTSNGITEFEDREAEEYSLSFTSEKRPGEDALKPSSVRGTVWVDLETTVRLKAEVEGVMEAGDFRKEFFIRLKRTKIGEEIALTPPI